MPYRTFHSRSAHRRPSGTRRLWGGVKALIFLGAIAAAGWFGFHQIVNSQLRGRVQEKIVEDLHGTGLQVSLGQARFYPGKGLQLNDLTIEHVGTAASRLPSAARSRIEIFEAFLTAPVTMAELATDELEIQAIRIRRAKLTLVRDESGNWDIRQAIESLSKLQPRQQSPIPVSLTDCEIRIIDLAKTTGGPVTLSNVSIVIQPRVHEGRPMLQVNGGFESSAVSRVEFTAFLDRQTERWKANLSATQARLSRDMIAVIPAEFQSELASLHELSAEINFSAEATGRMTFDEIPSFSIVGNVAKLAVDDARMPFAVSNVAGRFGINNHGIVLDGVSGQLGQSEFRFNYSQQGVLERASWQCDGNVQAFDFERSDRFLNWLPSHCKKFCHEYSPTGTCNIQFDLEFDQTWLKREILGDLTDMSFSYIGMPYQIDHCTGRVRLVDDKCTYNVRSIMNQQVIRLDGHASNFRDQPVYEVNISVPGDLPFDDKMLAAIDARPGFSKVIRAFDATGRVGGIGRIEKRVPGGEVIKSFDIRIQQCSVHHSGFDYPIHNISGLVQTRNDRFTFTELSGNNRNGKVVCDGSWNPVDGLALRFLCNSIPLTEQLRDALRPEIREIWDGFRPQGTLDFMRIDLTLPAGTTDVDVRVEATMSESVDQANANYLSIHPTWFPYEINQLKGTVSIGNGRIHLKDVKGWHQRTWLACQGGGDYSQESWAVKLEQLLVGSLRVDEDLLSAVPASLAPAIRGLKFDGLLTVDGEITLAGTLAPPSVGQQVGYESRVSPDPAGRHFSNRSSSLTGKIATTGRHQVSTRYPPRPAQTSMAWDLRFDMNEAKMQIGLPLENVWGYVQLVGLFDGETAQCQGELYIDSITVYDAQITKIRGPIWLDNDRAAAGIFARHQPTVATKNFSPTESKKKASSVTGDLHGGIVNLDAQMNNTGHNPDFYVQATLADSSLETACLEFAPHLKNIEGHCFAAFRMSGDFSGTHSNRGEGTIQLRDAKIYELPVFLSLLKILNVRQVTRTAFDSSNIDFRVIGDRIVFGRMEFIGDAISLIGNGTMNLDRDIDLNFYSVMGRNRFNIPIISELYRASSQEILLINVDGKLDDPQTHRHVLRGLSDTLQQLVQPRELSGVQDRFQREGQPFPSQTSDLRFQSPDSVRQQRQGSQ